MDDVLRALVLVALVLVNAFFVIGEYATVTARRAALAARARRGEPGARAAMALMDEPVRVISTVQVGITAVGILAGAVGEPLVREMLGDGVPAWLGFLIAFAAVTYVTVVVGELVPKALTLDRAETLAILVARPVRAAEVLLRPAVWGLEVSARLLLRPFGVRELSAGKGVGSPEELEAIVEEARGRGVLPRAQEELLHKVFDFAHLEARDAMIPEPEVDWLDAAAGAAAALEQVVRRPRSRYPVAEGTLDRLVGVVHVRELVAAARADPEAPIRDRAQPAPIVPETKDLGALLRELREERQHMAVVVDEYGGTMGIVTLEDILERIVGEIQNEYDLPGYALDWRDERTVAIEGSMTIDDFNESVGIELPHDGVRTMAGLAFDALGRRPAVGDRVRVGTVELAVEETDGSRVSRLRVTLPEPDDPAATREG
jgi:putative hemolysin